MRGTRYGDFSRPGADPGDGWSGVLLQQGRVQLDADFNDARAIGADALRTALADLMGGSWAPASDPGFGVRPRMALEFDGSDRLLLQESGDAGPGPHAHTLELWLTWDGGACVLVECRAVDEQPGYALAIDGHGRLVLRLGADDDSALRLYASTPLRPHAPAHLAVVVAADFAALVLGGRQVARSAHAGADDLSGLRIVLGGPIDERSPEHGFVGLVSEVRAWRTARTLAELAQGAEAPLALGAPAAEAGLAGNWSLDDPAGATRLAGARPRWRLTDLAIEPGRFYVDGVRCEQPVRGLYTRQPGAAPAPLPAEGEHLVYLELWEETVSAVEQPSLREVALGGLDTSVRTRIATRVRLAALDASAAPSEVLAPPAPADPGRLAAKHAGELVPGNQLYRVEVHETGRLGEDPPPTFKWSRDNGASLFAVAPGEQNDRLGLLYAASGVPALAPGDVVEPLPAGAPLDGPPPPLLRVREVSELDGSIVLDRAAPPGTALLRRWDHDPDRAAPHPRGAAGAALPATGAWAELEDGIRVRFEGGELRRGDYWWIVSRMDARTIEWPHRNGHPAALPPAGVERLSAPLALLSLRDGSVRVEDLRRIVAPLVAERGAPQVWPPEPPPAPVAPAPVEPPPADPEPVEPPQPPAQTAETETETVRVTETEVAVEVETPDGRTEEVVAVEEVVTVERTPAHETGWTHVGDVDLGGGVLHAAVGLGERIVLATERALFSLSVAKGVVELLGELPEPREGHALLAVEGLLLLAGGGPAADRPDGRLLAFEPASGAWSERAPAPVHHAHPALAAAHGWLHLLGGASASRMRHRLHASHHVYEVARDRWSEAPELPAPRAGAAAAALGAHLHVVGGRGHARSRQADVAHDALDLRSGAWEEREPLPRARAILGACAHRGRLVALLARHDGGEAGTALAFDPAAGAWELLPQLPQRAAAAIALSHRKRLYVLGMNLDGTVAIHGLA